jgi:ATP/maltotriose-dependent transcriptional regulator MalT
VRGLTAAPDVAVEAVVERLLEDVAAFGDRVWLVIDDLHELRSALPTNLSQTEIADELHLSVNTINTHIRHLFAKLGGHRRGEAVEGGRALGLLAPSSRRR